MVINNKYDLDETELSNVCDLLHLSPEVVLDEDTKQAQYGFCYANCDGSYNKYQQAN
jgi:hypothetical protein